MEENICRLCLKLVKIEFEIIDELTKQMLEVVLLKVDLDATKNNILCQDCVELAKKSYLFKSTCTDTKELILSYSAAKEKSSQFDIKDIYKENKDVKIVTCEDFNVCRFCMNQTERNNFTSLDVITNDVLYMEMMPVFMPEMVPNIIKDPVICTSCKENLESYFKFAQNFLDTEQKINKYRQKEGSCSTNQIDLSNLLEFLFKNTLTDPEKRTQIPMIKQESLIEDVEHNAERIKCEALDIKGEDLYLGENNFEIHKEYPLNYETKLKSNIEASCGSKNAQMYKCGICTFETKHKKHLITHTLVHKSTSEVEMYKCGICTFETKYKKHLITHTLVHKTTPEVEMYKCETCTYETKHKKNLKIHSLKHKNGAEIEMYKCEICSYKSKYKKSLQNHIINHRDICAMHKCELCTYETRLKANLKRHMLVHKDASEVEMHKCEVCNYETKYKKYLTTHMLVHQSASEVIMQKCDICSYETKYRKSLLNHILIHEDTCAMYKCAICTYETKYKSYLRKHMLVHKDNSEVEMHKCTMCTYETKRLDSLRTHVLIHKDCEMHKCGLCSYKTKYKYTLKRHMVIHKDSTEIEMYKCELCSYETKHKDNLKRHTLTHKNTLVAEIHKCRICSYETKYKRCLKKHMVMHQKSEMLVCL